MRKWLALLGCVVLALALMVSVKTLTMPSRQVAATAIKPVAVDTAAVSERLAAAVSRVAATDAPGYRAIARTLAELHPDIVVAPALMIGATDSRHFDGVAANVYKFSPVRATPEDLKRFHGTNERISTANYVEMIQFYHQLIGNASSADTSQDRSLP